MKWAVRPVAAVALAVAFIVIWELLKVAYPTTMQTVIEVGLIPAAVVVIVLLALSVRRLWQDVDQPPRSRL